MKEYIIKNLEPILLGIVIGIVFIVIKQAISDVIVKIALIINK